MESVPRGTMVGGPALAASVKIPTANKDEDLGRGWADYDLMYIVTKTITVQILADLSTRFGGAVAGHQSHRMGGGNRGGHRAGVRQRHRSFAEWWSTLDSKRHADFGRRCRRWP